MNRIVNYTIPCQPYPLTDFLRFGSVSERFYFESDQSPLAIAGLGITAQISRTGPNRFSGLSQDLREFFKRVTLLNDSDDSPRGARPVLLGGGSFFAEMEPGKWDSFPQAALVLPRYALIRVNGRYYFSVNLALTKAETVASASQRACIEAETFLAQLESAILPTPSIPNEITTNETSRVVWQNAIHHSVEMIHQGRLKKVVMARPVQVNGNSPIDIPPLLERLGESCPSSFRFLFEFSPGTAFAGVTPERLVSVSGAKFTTAAIAGSISSTCRQVWLIPK